ncbi:MAG: carboxypeptidase-like regulatory domain-containing protein, partial [Flavitalea sp.]
MKKIGCVVSPDTTHVIIKFLLMIKLAILLIIAMSAQSFANVYGQTNIDLKLEKVQLKKALKAIENQGVFRFVYKDAILPKEKVVSIEVYNATLDEVLGKLFQTTTLTYRKLSDNLIVITNAATIVNNLMVAAVKISGNVTNDKGEALGGVSVIERGTNNGTVTKPDGAFSLEVTNANAMLLFSFIGYRSQEIKANSGAQLSVILQTESSQLNDVVVIGYGSRQRKDVTGAISTINSEDITKSTASSSE